MQKCALPLALNKSVLQFDGTWFFALSRGRAADHVAQLAAAPGALTVSVEFLPAHPRELFAVLGVGVIAGPFVAFLLVVGRVPRQLVLHHQIGLGLFEIEIVAGPVARLNAFGGAEGVDIFTIDFVTGRVVVFEGHGLAQCVSGSARYDRWVFCDPAWLARFELTMDMCVLVHGVVFTPIFRATGMANKLTVVLTPLRQQLRRNRLHHLLVAFTD